MERSKIKDQRSKILSSVICYLLSDSFGQSIIEVLIALTLIIVFLAGVVVVQLFAVKNVTYSEYKSNATKLARQQLDRVKVVRDSVGINDPQLTVCQSSCFINSQLTPVQGVTPTGIFDQVVSMKTDTNCPTPESNPSAISYRITANVFLKGAEVTPMARLDTCLTDWR